MEYVIVTGAGYWGKGATLVEAAKNANVKGTAVRSMIVQSDPRLFESVTVDGDGGVLWHWNEDALEIPKRFVGAIRQISNLGYFHVKIIKGNLVITTIPE
jgi:transcription termination factor Rho